MIGQQILNYKIEKLIGEGGMGKVFLAQHTQLNRKVAIKVLHSHLTYSQEFRNRFKTEANLLANLQHQNIVTLHDYLENNDFLALIMEFVQGTPLDDYIKQRNYLPENELIPLFSQVLDAFQFAHENGIIHRDIKPANILLTSDGKIKILDFGIAKIKDSLTNTQTGTQMGTVLYMSPEQIKGQKVDIRSDIYSLGVTLFELATGKMPYNPNSSIYDVSNAIVHQPLPKPSSINPKISPQLEKIIQKATEKNPDLRFQNCLEFKNALQQNKNQKTLSSSLSFWVLVILLLAGLAFLGIQIYENKKNTADEYSEKLVSHEDETSLIEDKNNKTEKNNENENTTTDVVNETLPIRDFTGLSEGKNIQSKLNDFIQKINNQQDIMDFLDYKVKINQQELTKPEAFQKIKNLLKIGTSETENSQIQYFIDRDYKIYSHESNSNSYLSFKVPKLKIRRNVTGLNGLLETEEFEINWIFESDGFKIIEMEFL